MSLTIQAWLAIAASIPTLLWISTLVVVSRLSQKFSHQTATLFGRKRYAWAWAEDFRTLAVIFFFMSIGFGAVALCGIIDRKAKIDAQAKDCCIVSSPNQAVVVSYLQPSLVFSNPKRIEKTVFPGQSLCFRADPKTVKTETVPMPDM